MDITKPFHKMKYELRFRRKKVHLKPEGINEGKINDLKILYSFKLELQDRTKAKVLEKGDWVQYDECEVDNYLKSWKSQVPWRKGPNYLQHYIHLKTERTTSNLHHFYFHGVLTYYISMNH